MTYCLGWKNNNRVFLISDTAATTHQTGIYRINKATSSLGEPTLEVNGKFVEELLHKQFNIHDELIITYAGDVALALEVIDTIKKYYHYNPPFKTIELAIDSVRDYGLEKIDLQLLLGFKLGNDINFYTFNYNLSGQLEVVHDNILVQIGSMSSSATAQLAKKMFYQHIIKHVQPQKQFYQMLSFCQHFGIHDYTFSKFAGGIYTGLYMDTNGSHWGDDSSIILYNRNLIDPTKIAVVARINQFVRNNCLTISSSITGDGEFFIDSKNHEVYQSLALQEQLREEHIHFLPKVVIYLAVDERMISVIYLSKHRVNPHFYEENVNGKISTQLTGNFITLLKGGFYPTKNLFYIYWDEY